MKNVIRIFFSLTIVLYGCDHDVKDPVTPWILDMQNEDLQEKDASSDIGEDQTKATDLDSSDMFVGKVCDASPETIFTPKRNWEQLEGCEKSLSPISLVDYREIDIPQKFVGSLREIGPNGALTIYRNRYLENLDSFGNLEKIGGSLLLSNADALADIMGLQKLRFIGGRFELTALPIKNFDGLVNLEYIGGDVRIDSLSEIDSLDGLENLKKIEGDLLIDAEKITEEQFRAFLERVEVGGAINFQGNEWPSN